MDTLEWGFYNDVNKVLFVVVFIWDAAKIGLNCLSDRFKRLKTTEAASLWTLRCRASALSWCFSCV